jgi:predicted transcriptional regulator
MKKLMTFRFDADLLAKARHLAQRDNRTLTNFIETILKQSLDGKEWDDGALKVRGDRV